MIDAITTEERLGRLADDIVKGVVSDDVVASLRAEYDLLGKIFCRLRSPDRRRAMGATYTPRPVVDAMVTAARELHPAPVRIVDPGAGSGRFILAAAAAFPAAKLIAVEVDPLAIRLLRANATVQGCADRLEVIKESYLSVALPPVEGRTLFIGNPPYVRHHDVDRVWKTTYAERMARFGIKASQLAGLHLHFLAKTAEVVSKDDALCFITAAEWLDVNYGKAARVILTTHLGLLRLDILEPDIAVFDDAMTSAVIFSGIVGDHPTMIAVRRHTGVNGISLRGGRAVGVSRVGNLERWSGLGRTTGTKPQEAKLGDYFRVSRGQVTGGNGLWIVNGESGVPSRFLMPTITRAKELIAVGPVLTSLSGLKTVADLPKELDDLDQSDRAAVERFLRCVKSAGGANSYIAQHRSPWWSVRLLPPAPILCTYMARRAPAFVLNAAGARHLNIAHGLYPRMEVDANTLDAVVRWLRKNVGTDGGRTYAGGLIKFEPGELERLAIPPLEQLRDDASAAANMERRAA